MPYFVSFDKTNPYPLTRFSKYSNYYFPAKSISNGTKTVSVIFSSKRRSSNKPMMKRHIPTCFWAANSFSTCTSIYNALKTVRINVKRIQPHVVKPREIRMAHAFRSKINNNYFPDVIILLFISPLSSRTYPVNIMLILNNEITCPVHSISHRPV